ncbi:MAG: ATP-binding protein [Thermodesulfobacteriota bacterium]
MRRFTLPKGDEEKGGDRSRQQLLQYAEDLARLYARERAQRAALETANEELRLEIAERSRLQEELVQSEAKFRSLVEESRDAIYITSREGIILEANDSYLELLGYEREELIGTSVLKAYADPSVRPIFRKQVEEAGFVKGFAFRARRKDGTLIECELTSTVRKGKDGSILGYQGIVRDVTEDLRHRRMLELAKRMEALAHMAGGIAHEIRNPLAISSSAAQLLMKDGIPQQVRRECAGKIVVGIERASLVIGNLLAFATLVRDRAHDEIDLVAVISDTLKAVSPLAARQGVAIVARLDPHRCLVLGQQEMLHRAFLNLFANALDALPENGVLLVTVETADAEASVTIRDYGSGMAEEHVSRIFDPFFSGSSRSKRTGLGLSVAYSTVVQHGGTIQVDSAVGKGTRFLVKFPLSNHWDTHDSENRPLRC